MDDTMDLRQIFNIILRRLWIIILVTVVATLSSGIISYFVLEDIYQASTTLMVSKTRDDQTTNLQYNDILLNQKLVKTYSEVAKSNRVLEKVVEKLELDMSVDAQEQGTGSFVADAEISYLCGGSGSRFAAGWPILLWYYQR